MSAPRGLHVISIVVEREQRLACHHDFLWSAHNAKAGGHSAHVHAHTLRQARAAHTAREQRGNGNISSRISRSLCFLPHSLSSLLCLPLLTPSEGERGAGADGGGAVWGPRHGGPHQLQAATVSEKTWAQRHKHRKHNVL